MPAQKFAFAEGLTPEEEGKVVELAAAVAATVEPCAPHRAFCSRGTYVRYLRARQWSVHKAARMLEDTLKWRADFRPEALTVEALAEEATLGKMYILDAPDVEGRPVVFMCPRKERPGGDISGRLKWVVYVMEAASRLADESAPDGKMTWLLDFVGYSRRNQPPWTLSLHTLQIVQSHYPERLGRAVNFQPPFMFEIFWRAIRPFVDPVTRGKLVFMHEGDAEGEGGGMSSYFDLQGLERGVGGELEENGSFHLESNGARMRALEGARDQQLEAAAAVAAGGNGAA